MAAPSYAFDDTLAFHIALYVLVVETLLFFAVVMHSQTCEPMLHPGVARHFGLLFLFQAASALLMVVAEQTFPSPVSQAFALLTIVTIAFAVCMSIPAALVVAFPEGGETTRRASAAAAFVAILALCTLALPGGSKAVLDLPYVPRLVRAKTLGAMAGAAAVLAVASAIRMARGLKGANGALILAAAVTVLSIFGLIWAALEPYCRSIADKGFPDSCPLPRAFDHNVLVTVLMILCNALAAEGVLRLMQAGDGGQGQGYISIQV